MVQYPKEFSVEGACPLSISRKVYYSCKIKCITYAHISNESQKEKVDNAEVYFSGRHERIFKEKS
jgi:hypothetical protein